ncbi:MAG TPA: hypothetical protein VIT23_03845 [Terrimicrobiaceae bacterium]
MNSYILSRPKQLLKSSMPFAGGEKIKLHWWESSVISVEKNLFRGHQTDFEHLKVADRYD